MRYAVFSDIHGNLEAFNAVLTALDKERVDKFLYVGDIVGYGADPIECLNKMQELDPVVVCGNHDWAVCDLVNTDYFNTAARNAALWTKERLGKEYIEYLKSMKLKYENKDVTLVHGTLDRPDAFSYILDGYGAQKTMALMKTNVCFIGHSHVAGVFYRDKRTINYTATSEVALQPSVKYIVNVGSVGQPRDGDPRASFCIYDDVERLIEIKRISYDVAGAQRKILEAGLPEVLALRLSEGR